MNRDKRPGIKGRQRPLVPIPSEAIPEGTRCIELQIPDSDAAERQMMGMLNLLAFWTSYEREPTHSGALWAKAWKTALLNDITIEGCMQIQFQQTLCGLVVSFDGGATWEEIYDGMDCLSSQGGQEFIDGLIDSAIQDLIDDGTLQQGGGQPSPEAPPDPGGCQSYHVVLAGNERWKYPGTIRTGDIISISNAHGGWSDGTIHWHCWDGKFYILAQCGNDDAYDAGDPLQAGNHMQLIGGYSESAPTYFNPLTDYTVPAGVTDQEMWLQANDGQLYDNTGEIEFDVEVCRPGWTHYFDFRVCPPGWTAWDFCAGTCTYEQGYVVGCHISNYYLQAQYRAVTLPADCHITRLIQHFTGTPGSQAKYVFVDYPLNTHLYSHNVSTYGDGIVDHGAMDVNRNGVVYVKWGWNSQSNGQCAIIGLTIQGTGTEPTW